jgi:hypothetical protein
VTWRSTAGRESQTEETEKDTRDRERQQVSIQQKQSNKTRAAALQVHHSRQAGSQQRDKEEAVKEW